MCKWSFISQILRRVFASTGLVKLNCEPSLRLTTKCKFWGGKLNRSEFSVEVALFNPVRRQNASSTTDLAPPTD